MIAVNYIAQRYDCGCSSYCFPPPDAFKESQFDIPRLSTFSEDNLIGGKNRSSNSLRKAVGGTNRLFEVRVSDRFRSRPDSCRFENCAKINKAIEIKKNAFRELEPF